MPAKPNTQNRKLIEITASRAHRPMERTKMRRRIRSSSRWFARHRLGGRRSSNARAALATGLFSALGDSPLESASRHTGITSAFLPLTQRPSRSTPHPSSGVRFGRGKMRGFRRGAFRRPPSINRRPRSSSSPQIPRSGPVRYSVSAAITPHARELSATTAEKLASSRDGFASRFHFFLQIYYLGHAIAPGRFALDLSL